jgi:hypothetical protein
MPLVTQALASVARGHWHRNLAGIVAVGALGLIASSCRHRQRFVEPADSPQHLGVIDQVFGNDMDGAARALAASLELSALLMTTGW